MSGLPSSAADDYIVNRILCINLGQERHSISRQRRQHNSTQTLSVAPMLGVETTNVADVANTSNRGGGGHASANASKSVPRPHHALQQTPLARHDHVSSQTHATTVAGVRVGACVPLPPPPPSLTTRSSLASQLALAAALASPAAATRAHELARHAEQLLSVLPVLRSDADTAPCVAELAFDVFGLCSTNDNDDNHRRSNDFVGGNSGLVDGELGINQRNQHQLSIGNGAGTGSDVIPLDDVPMPWVHTQPYKRPPPPRSTPGTPPPTRVAARDDNDTDQVGFVACGAAHASQNIPLIPTTATDTAMDDAAVPDAVVASTIRTRPKTTQDVAKEVCVRLGDAELPTNVDADTDHNSNSNPDNSDDDNNDNNNKNSVPVPDLQPHRRPRTTTKHRIATNTSHTTPTHATSGTTPSTAPRRAVLTAVLTRIAASATLNNTVANGVAARRDIDAGLTAARALTPADCAIAATTAGNVTLRAALKVLVATADAEAIVPHEGSNVGGDIQRTPSAFVAPSPASNAGDVSNTSQVSATEAENNVEEWQTAFATAIDSCSLRMAAVDLLALLLARTSVAHVGYNNGSTAMHADAGEHATMVDVEPTRKTPHNMENPDIIVRNDDSDAVLANAASEEFVVACVSAVRETLSFVYMPYLELSLKPDDSLSTLEQAMLAAVFAKRRDLTTVLRSMTSAIWSLVALIGQNVVPERCVINLIFFATQVFFADYSHSSLDINPLKLACLRICSAVTSSYPEQRMFVLNEVLSLVGPFFGKVTSKACKTLKVGTNPGLTLNCVTVLLLEILQGCSDVRGLSAAASSFRDGIKRVKEGKTCDGGAIIDQHTDAEQESKPSRGRSRRKATSQSKKAKTASAKKGTNIKKKDVVNSEENTPMTEASVIDEFGKQLRSGLEVSYRLSRYIFKFLLSRTMVPTSVGNESSRQKQAGGVNRKEAMDTESILTQYWKAALTAVAKDILSLIGNCEWPAADICAVSYTQILNGYLVTNATSKGSKGDQTLRLSALEFIGDVCCELRKRKIALRDNPIHNLPAFQLKMDNPETINSGNMIVVASLEHSILEYLMDQEAVDETVYNSMLYLLSCFAYHVSVDTSQLDSDKLELVLRMMFNYVRLIEKQYLSLRNGSKLIHLSSVTNSLETSVDSGLQLSKELLVDRPLIFDTDRALNESVLYRHPTIAKLYMHVASQMGLQQSFEQLVVNIASCVDSDVVALRIKALRALQSVFNVEPSLESWNPVRTFVERNLVHTSASVRDVALDMLGESLKFDKSLSLHVEYHAAIANRTLDVSVAVRKRALKLIKDILSELFKSRQYAYGDRYKAMYITLVDKMFSRLGDDESSISALALNIIETLFFGKLTGVNYNLLDDPDNPSANLGSSRLRDFIELTLNENSSLFDSLSDTEKSDIFKFAILLADFNYGICMDDLVQKGLSKIVQLIQEKGTRHDRFQFVVTLKVYVDTWANFLDTPSRDESYDEKCTVILCALHQVSIVYPELLACHLECLTRLSYRGVGTQPVGSNLSEERRLSLIFDTMANIFRRVPNAGSRSTVESIQSYLFKILNTASRQTVVHAVMCLSLIVKNVTKQYLDIASLVEKCCRYIQRVILFYTEKKQVDKVPMQAVNNAMRCILIISAILRHIKIDTLLDLSSDMSSDLKAVIVSLPEGKSLVDFLLSSLITLVNVNEIPEQRKTPLILSLGEILLSNPRSLLDDDVVLCMRCILQGNSQNEIADSENCNVLKVALLDVFISFMQVEPGIEEEKRNMKLLDDHADTTAAIDANALSQSSVSRKKKSRQKVDMKILVGNSDELGETTIARSAIQMFIGDILNCLKSTDTNLSGTAFDVVEMIVEQGLVFPTMIIPQIVSLEASRNVHNRLKALDLHKYFVQKHMSLVVTCDFDCVMEMYRYCKAQSGYRVDESKNDVIPFVCNENGESVSYPETALIENIYDQIRSQKRHRIRFLRSLVKMLDFMSPESEGKYSDIIAIFSESQGKPRIRDVTFMKFLCEQLLLLNYKYEEEVLLILSAICEVLAVSGIQVVRVLKDLLSSDSELLTEYPEAASFIDMHRDSLRTEVIYDVFNAGDLEGNMSDDATAVDKVEAEKIEQPVKQTTTSGRGRSNATAVSEQRVEKVVKKQSVKAVDVQNEGSGLRKSARVRRPTAKGSSIAKLEQNQDIDESSDTESVGHKSMEHSDGKEDEEEYKADLESGSSSSSDASSDEADEEESQSSESSYDNEDNSIESSYSLPRKRKHNSRSVGKPLKKGDRKLSRAMKSNVPMSSVLQNLFRPEKPSKTGEVDTEIIMASFNSSDNDKQTNHVIMRHLESSVSAVLLLSKLRSSLQSLYNLNSDKIIQFSNAVHQNGMPDESNRTTPGVFDRLATRKIRVSASNKTGGLNRESIMWSFDTDLAKYLLASD